MQKKVLMVCLGNICRSPLAEGILASKVDADKVLVDSAGTSDWHVGKQPDPRSIEVAEQFGIDISQTALQLQYFLGDRKSTRLNSSHVAISYAVFCLKKKKSRQIRKHRVSLT